jgi:hypothetical protein
MSVYEDLTVTKFTNAPAFKALTNALVFGSGKSSAKHSLGSSAGNAVEMYFDATHTTGDMRGQYLYLSFSGTNGSGEALRAKGVINNKTVAYGGTVNGAHITLEATGESAAVSGAANALRVTFGQSATVGQIGGTCATIQVDTDFDNASTVPTNFAFLRFTNSNTKVAENLMRIPNAANGTIFAAHDTQTMTHSIKIISEDGTAYYVMCTDAATNRS